MTNDTAVLDFDVDVETIIEMCILISYLEVHDFHKQEYNYSMLDSREFTELLDDPEFCVWATDYEALADHIFNTGVTNFMLPDWENIEKWEYYNGRFDLDGVMEKVAEELGIDEDLCMALWLHRDSRLDELSDFWEKLEDDISNDSKSPSPYGLDVYILNDLGVVCGDHESMTEYAEKLTAENVDDFVTIPTAIRHYFDVDGWARDAVSESGIESILGSGRGYTEHGDYAVVSTK